MCSGRIEMTVESETRVSSWAGTRRMVFLMRTGRLPKEVYGVSKAGAFKTGLDKALGSLL